MGIGGVVMVCSFFLEISSVSASQIVPWATQMMYLSFSLEILLSSEWLGCNASLHSLLLNLSSVLPVIAFSICYLWHI